MAAAALALVGLLLATYLLLHSLGFTGPLVCGTSASCDTVQSSRYAKFLGLPVAGYGVGGYGALFAIALAGLQPRWAERRGPTVWLTVLAAIGVAFTVYLTYLELFVIHAICRWCVGSAAIIVAIFGVSLTGLRKGVMGDG